MNHQKWEHFLSLAKMPDSLTSLENRRRVEALYFLTFATDGWDRTKRLLILGCGDGYEVKMAHEAGFEFVRGVTFYPEEFRLSETIAPGEVMRADIHDLPFEDGDFDYVISKETLEHAIAPFVALCESNRVMKEGGEFRHYIPEGEQKESEHYHYMCAPTWLWRDLMEKAGFQIDEITRQLDQNKFSGRKVRRYDD